MSEEKTCLYICRPRQGGKTVKQLQYIIKQGVTKIIVQESDLKAQRDTLLEALKDLYQIVVAEELIPEFVPCMKNAKAAIAKAEPKEVKA